VENLDRYYALFKDMLLDPGFRPEDFKRLRENAINYLKVSLREGNDEELGKEHLYEMVYSDHAYGHPNTGRVRSLENSQFSIQDVAAFYRAHYTTPNLVIGVSGGYPMGFPEKIESDFSKLPSGSADKKPHFAAPKLSAGTHIDIITRDTRST